MKVLISIAVSVFIVSASACDSRDGTTREQRQATEPNAVRPADLNWSDLDPTGAPGVQIATLWGNHATGGFGAFFKLPAGFAAPLHRHTHDMKLVIVSGMYIQAQDGAGEFRLGPGSYLLQPGGDYRHTTSCHQGSDCIFFVESEGAFDLHLAEAPATAN